MRSKATCHPDKPLRGRGLCGACYNRWWAEQNPERHAANRARQRDHARTWQRKYDKRRHPQKLLWEKQNLAKLRATVLAGLGGKCSCCGETQNEFLTLEHVNGGGRAHRKAARSLYRVYHDVIDSGFDRSKYDVLCYNCNCSRGRWGYCPHQKQLAALEAL